MSDSLVVQGSLGADEVQASNMDESILGSDAGSDEEWSDGHIPTYSELHDGQIEILSIDDDPVNQMVIEGLLVPQGYIVTPALDGDSALSILQERGFVPDVVLLDCQVCWCV